MVMLMMFVMNVPVLVRNRFVNVFVFMPLGQMQP